jgi:subtilisin family serine protease
MCYTSAIAAFRMTHGDQVAMIAGGTKSVLPGALLISGSYTIPGENGTFVAAQDLSITTSSPIFGVAKDATVLRSDFLTYQSNTNGLFSVLKDWGTGTDAASQAYRSLKVVNLSLGGTSTNPVQNIASYDTYLAYANASVTPDAVFVKAAGNSACVVSQTNCDPANAVFYNSAPFKDKSILVGALTQPGGLLASYSNKAGTFSDRFVVADGRGIQQTDGTYDQGTSFAAPRVSGYAAIIRQKFPNLTAPNTANVIFDTASWNTSWGAKDAANQAIYGQGEANLGRALAPIGNLR